MAEPPGEGDTVVVGPPQALVLNGFFAGRYQVGDILGRGGMGTVYRMHDTALDQAVAVKVLARSGDAANRDYPERFREEVRLARRVTHANVIRIYDLGEHQDVLYFTMELVEGTTLRRSLDSLSRERALEIAVEVCEGLAAAHAAGVIHRDLKPENVLLQTDGRVVVTDFGIARAADVPTTGEQIGTPGYMAPEQIAGQDVGTRTDLYAVGLLVYEMLTGHLPYASAWSQHCAALLRLEAAPKDVRDQLDVPEALAEVIRSCLEPDPSLRPASAADLAAAFRGNVGVPTAPLRGPRPRPPAAPREPAVAVLPFRDRSGTAPQLASGLTDELIDVLSRTRGLRVLARGAIEAFATDRDPGRVAAKLGADVLVDAGLDITGDVVRVDAHLVEAPGGRQVWSERFEGTMAHVLPFQEWLGRRVCEALRVELELRPQQQSVPPELVALYFRARRKLHNYELVGPDGGIALLEQALAIAPDFPPALAAHALACVRRWFAPIAGSPRDWRGDAERSVARALRDAAALPEAHFAAGLLAAHTADYGAAGRELGLALDLAPTYADAMAYLGQLQCEAGRVHDGVRRLRQAYDLDPTLRVALVDLARHHILHGRPQAYERIIAMVDRASAKTFGPALQLRLRVAAWRGDDRGLREQAARIRGEVANLFARGYARVLLREIDPAEAERELVELVQSIGNPRSVTYGHQLFAESLALLGQFEAAHRHLEIAARTALIDLEWLDRCPALNSMRGTPGFAASRQLVLDRAAAIPPG